MAAHLTESDCKGYNAVDGTDDMFWQDSEGDGDVRSKHEEDEGTDCEDGDRATDW